MTSVVPDFTSAAQSGSAPSRVWPVRKVSARDVAMGNRDAECGGGANTGGDTAHDFDFDAVCREHEQLFAPAPEDEGIAALEARHRQAALGAADHELLDECLRRRPAAAALARRDHTRLRRVIEHRGVHEVVGDDHVGLTQRAHRFQGKQLRVAGTCADEPHLAAFALVHAACLSCFW